ncbi:hypothetical protein, partial [Pedobacter sp. V48]|uniref:hypothetical protein n=1 Tax=Pedobacter sp. V48 TaxID=509635 RepID=UPI001F3C4963
MTSKPARVTENHPIHINYKLLKWMLTKQDLLVDQSKKYFLVLCTIYLKVPSGLGLVKERHTLNHPADKLLQCGLSLNRTNRRMI